MTWMKLGEVEIGRIIESNGPFMSVYDFFPDATPELLAPHRHWLDQGALDPRTDELIMPIQSYVVRTPRHVVLVDSCVGNHKSVKWYPAWDQMNGTSYLAGLATLGLRPEDIDVVLCSHLHVDHSGWNTRWQDGRWHPTFPNARYILSKKEVEGAEYLHTKYGDPTYAENVLPVIEAGQAVLVADDHQVDDHVWLEPTPGHTRGHCAIRVDGRGGDAVITGDLIHSPVQCQFPHWNFRHDFDKAQAAATRRGFLERYCECATQVLTAHFPLPSAGHLRRAGDAFRFEYWPAGAFI
ncbi:MAG: MBL fold metallo-hydrolase [Gammaproteobacteria bacterium]|nr:MBL fold metallo-hydrolase [Gammaproteobacteria bacterium]